MRFMMLMIPRVYQGDGGPEGQPSRAHSERSVAIPAAEAQVEKHRLPSCCT